MHERHTRREGFTLIEIMAVVLIIGLLTGVVGFQIFAQVDKGRVTAARTQMNMLEGGAECSPAHDDGRTASSSTGGLTSFSSTTSQSRCITSGRRTKREANATRPARIPALQTLIATIVRIESIASSREGAA